MDARAVVAAAAARTMRGTAHVTLACRVSVPGYEGDSRYVGVVDFDLDRCRLDASEEPDPAPMVFDGPVAYMRQADGCWAWTRGAPGTHSIFAPQCSLEALVHAQRSAVAAGGRAVEVALDYAKLNAATDNGLAPDWTESSAVVVLSSSESESERIARITLTHGSGDDPHAWIQLDHRISEPIPPCIIDLPAPAISLEEHLRRLEADADR